MPYCHLAWQKISSLNCPVCFCHLAWAKISFLSCQFIAELTIPGIMEMPYREAGDLVKGRSQNIALVTNTGSFVQAILYLELMPACGRIGHQ